MEDVFGRTLIHVLNLADGHFLEAALGLATLAFIALYMRREKAEAKLSPVDPYSMIRRIDALELKHDNLREQIEHLRQEFYLQMQFIAPTVKRR